MGENDRGLTILAILDMAGAKGRTRVDTTAV